MPAMSRFVLDLLRTVEDPQAADWIIGKPDATRIEAVLDARGLVAPTVGCVAAILSGQKWQVEILRQIRCETFLTCTPPVSIVLAAAGPAIVGTAASQPGGALSPEIHERLRAIAAWFVRWPANPSVYPASRDPAVPAPAPVSLAAVFMETLGNVRGDRADPPGREIGRWLMAEPGGYDAPTQLTAFLEVLGRYGFRLPPGLPLIGPVGMKALGWRAIVPPMEPEMSAAQPTTTAQPAPTPACGSPGCAVTGAHTHAPATPPAPACRSAGCTTAENHTHAPDGRVILPNGRPMFGPNSARWNQWAPAKEVAAVVNKPVGQNAEAAVREGAARAAQAAANARGPVVTIAHDLKVAAAAGVLPVPPSPAPTPTRVDLIELE